MPAPQAEAGLHHCWKSAAVLVVSGSSGMHVNLQMNVGECPGSVSTLFLRVMLNLLDSKESKKELTVVPSETEKDNGYQHTSLDEYWRNFHIKYCVLCPWQCHNNFVIYWELSALWSILLNRWWLVLVKLWLPHFVLFVFGGVLFLWLSSYIRHTYSSGLK